MLNTETARKILGKAGEALTEKEVETLVKQLYGFINEILNNRMEEICKKQ